MSLHHSSEWPDSDPDDEDSGVEEEFTDEDAELVNDVDFVSDYLRAYDWILVGCPDITRYG